MPSETTGNNTAVQPLVHQKHQHAKIRQQTDKVLFSKVEIGFIQGDIIVPAKMMGMEPFPSLFGMYLWIRMGSIHDEQKFVITRLDPEDKRRS